MPAPYGSAAHRSVAAPYAAPAPAPGPYPSTAPGTPSAAPGYGYAPLAPARPTSGLAITSLICGIAGLALSFFVIPLLASIVAVITGHMALNQTKRDMSIGGRGIAVAGLVLGYLGLAGIAFIVIALIVSFLFFGSAFLAYLPLLSS